MEVLIPATRPLTVQAAALPQPDQLCGPFAAYVALHALLAEPPAVADLALAAGTSVWPHDVAEWRPEGAPFLPDGWEGLPRAGSPDSSGTDAAGLAAGIVALTGIAVVPAAGGAPASAWRRLFDGVSAALYDVGVVVNLVVELGSGPGSVGHFAAVAGHDGDRVLLADSYAELGDPGEPAGCHWLSLGEVAVAVALPPGRGLLLLVEPAHAVAARELVTTAGLADRLWST